MGCTTRPRAGVCPKGHDGFTVVELVISVSILLLVLMSLYPLLNATTAMSVKSKGTAALTNAIASEAERLRDLPFSTVSSSILTPQTLTVNGFVITLTEVLTDLTGPGGNGTKVVAITASTGGTGGIAALSSTVSIALRDLSSIVIPPGSGGTSSTAEITFGPSSPTEYAVFHEAYWGYSPYSPLIIDAVANVPDDEIAKIEFLVDGIAGTATLLQNSPDYTTSILAQTVYSSPRPSSATYSFSWDTRQVEKTSLHRPEIRNGLRTVRIVVTDSMGVQTVDTRKYLIDNQSELPESIPATALATALRKNLDMTQDILMTWPSWRTDQFWYDGTSPVPNYSNRLYQAPPWTADVTGWTISSLDTPNTSRVATSVAPFSLYTWAVRGESALGWHDSSGPLHGRTQAGYTLTLPVAGGTYTGTHSVGSGNKVTSSSKSLVTLTRPTYPANVTKVEVLRGTTGVTNPLPANFTWDATWTDVTSAAKTAWATSPSYAYTYDDTYTNNAEKNPVYPGYKFRVTLTPSGPSVGQQVLTSSIAYVPFMTGPMPALTPLSRMWP